MIRMTLDTFPTIGGDESRPRARQKTSFDRNYGQPEWSLKIDENFFLCFEYFLNLLNKN